jgi:nicotinamidase-related amidase
VSAPLPSPSPLLLCLDLQPALLRAVGDGERVLRRCAFAVASARGLGIPVAFTEQVPAKLGGTEPSLLGLAATPEVHPKDTFSALAAGSPARRALTEGRSLGRLLVCGVETPVCVYQTAVDALKFGLAVTVLTDCVGARREADARACLDALARSGAQLLPSETVFYSLLGGAAHPFFRGYTQLVKTYG